MDWFEKNPVKSTITYTILIMGAVFAFSKFVLIENTERDYEAQLATKDAVIAQYEARIRFLENENIKLENDRSKYIEWLRNTPGTIHYVEQKNQDLKLALEKEKEGNKGNNENNGEYFKEYLSVNGDSAIVDEKTQIIFSINNINSFNEGDLSMTVPNSESENIENIEAGFTKEFVVNTVSYQFVLVSVDYVSNTYSVILKEI